MSGFWLVVIVALIAWILYINSKNSEFANKNAEIANQNLKAVSHNYAIVQILTRILIKQLGVEKAARIYIDAIRNTVGATPILRQMYKDAGLPEEYGDYLYMVTDGGWTHDDYMKHHARNQKIVLRSVVTSFANLKEQMEDEIDNS